MQNKILDHYHLQKQIKDSEWKTLMDMNIFSQKTLYEYSFSWKKKKNGKFTLLHKTSENFKLKR